MKQVKRGLKCALLSAVLYAMLLVSVSWLALHGTLREEQFGTVCVICAALTAFIGVLVQRFLHKDSGFLSSILCVGGFFLFAVLTAFLFGENIVWKQVFVTLAAVGVSGTAANAIYAKGGFGRKKRGRGRGVNR